MGQTPHDALFKAVFEDPKIAAEHLAALLPAAVLRHLDLSQLKETRASFVDLELDEHHSDLLFEVLLSGQDALLFLLFEHQRGRTATTGASPGVEAPRWWRCRARRCSPVLPQGRFSVASGDGSAARDVLVVVGRSQSTPSPFMALRLLRYMLRIWERWQLEHLGLRFGPLPEQAVPRVRAASVAELNRWLAEAPPTIGLPQPRGGRGGFLK